jgi:hypothetical protein
MRQNGVPSTRPLARLIARITVAAGVIASMAFPVFAQDGTGPLPQNAQSRSYGGGRDCDLGYRLEGAECLALEIPENAYATGMSYGSGWACRRGYEEAGGTSCAAIPVPDNAFLRSSRHDWQCNRGYRQDRETCVPIVLPDNAYLTDDTSEFGWACERGFTARSSDCVPIAVPENGCLTNADHGDEWACERGFFEIDGRCDPVALPGTKWPFAASVPKTALRAFQLQRKTRRAGRGSLLLQRERVLKSARHHFRVVQNGYYLRRRRSTFGRADW